MLRHDIVPRFRAGTDTDSHTHPLKSDIDALRREFLVPPSCRYVDLFRFELIHFQSGLTGRSFFWPIVQWVGLYI